MINIHRSIFALLNVVNELYRKEIETFRITKTSSLLLMAGVDKNSISDNIIKKCVNEQKEDGGWVGVTDTIWNTKFLKLIDEAKYDINIKKALAWLKNQQLTDKLWGRSYRDMSRIPVTGVLLYLLPELASDESLNALEKLWAKECNSITYKAAYTLMAFKKNNYSPTNTSLILNTINWLKEQQKNDGGFTPWKKHPIESQVFCTAIALLGLIQFPEMVETNVFKNGMNWLVKNQLPTGMWAYHQIEDGCSWGLFALKSLVEYEEKNIINIS